MGKTCSSFKQMCCTASCVNVFLTCKIYGKFFIRNCLNKYIVRNKVLKLKLEVFLKSVPNGCNSCSEGKKEKKIQASSSPSSPPRIDKLEQLEKLEKSEKMMDAFLTSVNPQSGLANRNEKSNTKIKTIRVSWTTKNLYKHLSYMDLVVIFWFIWSS
mgnify:CR=1 FL=1